jgi:hypothetical protein
MENLRVLDMLRPQPISFDRKVVEESEIILNFMILLREIF